jgi:hypothetical protein
VHINDAFDPEFVSYEDGSRPAASDVLVPGHDYHAVAARPTTQDGLIETGAGVRAVVWDLGVETERGVVWVPDTMLDPPYSDI